MKERSLPLHISDDSTIVVLSETERAALQKHVTDFNGAFSHLLQQYNEGTLDVGMKETILPLLEHYLRDFLKVLGYEGQLERDMEERSVRIRSLNMENRELRAQLGMKVSNEDARERMKLMHDSVYKFFDSHGFFTTAHSFTGYSLSFELSGNLMGAYKRNGESFSALDLEVFEESIVANDDSMNRLTAFIQAKYPSSEVTEIRLYTRNVKSTLRSLNVYIRDLDDIEIATF